MQTDFAGEGALDGANADAHLHLVNLSGVRQLLTAGETFSNPIGVREEVPKRLRRDAVKLKLACNLHEAASAGALDSSLQSSACKDTCQVQPVISRRMDIIECCDTHTRPFACCSQHIRSWTRAFQGFFRF